MERFWLQQKGQTLVEVSLVIPILLFFFFILWQFLILFNAKLVLEHYAFELARSAATHQGRLTAGQPVIKRLKQTLNLTTGGTALAPTYRLKEESSLLSLRLTTKVKLLPGLAILAAVFKQNYLVISATGVIVKEPYIGEN